MKFDAKAFAGKKACVIGLGKSGLACAKLLSQKGFRVFATDSRPKKELEDALSRLPKNVETECGRHGKRALSCAFAVKSPGLAPGHPLLRELRQAEIPIFSELEIGLAFSKASKTIAITGTNGKTTTTMLTHAILKKSLVCGNLGEPVTLITPKAKKNDALVVEVSSYQLEDSRYFRPSAAAILNITPDHIDHHGSMKAYIRAKARIFSFQNKTDVCVFNADDPLTMKLSRECWATRLFFGRPGAHVHAWEEKGKIHVRLPGKKEMIFIPPKLPGRHNIENAMAAALLALSAGALPAAVQAAFRSFKGVEHRIEEAGTFRGLRCVNDSKATNVDSTLTALRAFPENEKNLLLILGGLHKASPYTPLHPLVESRVKAILTIGSAARKIEEDLTGNTPIFPCETLDVAVQTAFQIASKGDILLLSPACASFDQFKNFEERGQKFKELVRLKG